MRLQKTPGTLIVCCLVLISAVSSLSVSGDRCGIVQCRVGQSCCGPNSNSPSCYWLHNESCCESTAVASFPITSAICLKGQSCCGTTSYAPQCYWSNESTCCASADSLPSICAAHSSCCPTWGPPQLYKCCSAATSCCSNGGGDTEEGACCLKGTTCCLTSDGVEQCCIAGEKCSTSGEGCVNQTSL